VTAAVATFTIVPLGVIAATPRLHDSGRQAVRFGDNLIPVTSVGLQGATDGNAVHLSWNTPSGGSVFYRVLRWNTATAGGVVCAGTPRSASDDCELLTTVAATTKTPSVVDHPGSGTWEYRIGVAANWLNDPTLGDVYVVSPPLTVTVR
jgi:hypothetical protein